MFKEKNKMIKNILVRVSEKNRGLAGILEQVFEGMGEIPNQRDYDNRIRREEKINKKLNRAIDWAADKIGSINMIPGVPGSCYPLCIVKAFGKWNSRKYGFKGMAERSIDYWAACSEINRDTIIFTNAWDEFDFNEKYKKYFDSYSNNPKKTVCVILVTSQGLLIQYLS